MTPPRRSRVLVVLSVLFAAVALPARGYAADRFVSTTGTDGGNDCLMATSPCRSIGYAVAQTSSGDTINVAGEDYTDSIYNMTPTTLVFLGGWDEQFGVRDPLGNPAVLRATPLTPQGQRAWLIAGGNIDITIDGFVIRDGESYPGGTLTPLPDSGGGLLVWADDGPINLVVRNTTFTRNTAIDKRQHSGRDGGGVALDGDQPITASFTNVTFSRNRAREGAGLHVGFGANATVDLTNCLFTKNRSFDPPGTGAAISTGGGVMTILNSTIIKNRSKSGSAGSAVRVLPATLDLTNTIVWQTIADSDLLVSHNGVVNADHSDIGVVTLQSGTFNDLGGNLSVDPRVRPDGTIRDDGSPVIDAGTCSGAPSTDFEGDPRPTGAGCDIGADEFVP